MVGYATVTSVEPAPDRCAEHGEGNFVTGLVEHDADNIVELILSDGTSLFPTSTHPFWSESASSWIPAGALSVGERLRAESGEDVTVLAMKAQRRVEAVYNLEIDRSHVYLVGQSGILVHNQCDDDIPDGIDGDTDGFHETSGQREGRAFREDWLEVYEFDPDQPRHVRGWLRQERHRRARGNGPNRTRTPPGFQQGHGRTTPAREGFSYESSDLTSAELNALENNTRMRNRGN